MRGLVFAQRIKTVWSTVLPLVQRIMNASVHKSIGVSPAQLVFGNSIDLDRGLFPRGQALPETEMTPTVRQYLETLLQAQGHLIELAQQQQAETDLTHIETAVKKRNGPVTEFPINSYVLLNYPAGLGDMHKPPTKLHTRWRGPYRVSAVRGDEYSLQDLITLKSSYHHVKDIKAFQWNAARVDPEEVAYRDKDVFEVQNIIKHRGDVKRVSTLQFFVKWFGYDDSTNTWEPWKHLRTNARLHAYLEAHGLGNLIPKQFRNAE